MGRIYPPLAHFLDVWEERIHHHYCIHFPVLLQFLVSSRFALAAEDSAANMVVLPPMLKQERFWCACETTVQLDTFACASVQSDVERICVASYCDSQLSREIGCFAAAI